MKKFQVTRLSQLEPQDRFYFPKNKNLLCTYINTLDTQTYTYKNDNGTYIEEIKDLKVVYLRNINDK